METNVTEGGRREVAAIPGALTANATIFDSGIRKQVYWLIACIVIITFSAVMAYNFKHSFGKIDIQRVRLIDESGEPIAGLLFRPVAATPQNKLPGVLNLHGYQNDKECQNSFSIELARRGFVVLATDSLGHGDSGGTTNRVRLNGDPTFTIGANTGYLYLKNLPFVDSANLGIMGHSMGGIQALKIAKLNPDHRAVNPHASSGGSPDLHNLMLTMARFDEFLYFREMQGRTETIGSNPALLKKLGQAGPIQFDTTYGDLSQGTARRVAYVNMDHHFLPLTNKAVAEAADWMRQALKGGRKDAYWIEPTSQIFIWAELFGLVTLVVAILSLIPLTNILLATRFFRPVAQPMPSRYVAPTGKWWLFATINALIGGILYPILTQPAGLVDKVPNYLPFMRLQMGDGFMLWWVGNVVVCSILFYIWYRTSAKKDGLTMHDMGASFGKWSVLGKTLLVGVLLFAWMYLLEGVFQWGLGQEFRFVWPYMRQFSGLWRFGLFLIYVIPALAFFLVNGGLFLFGQARPNESGSEGRTTFIWWLKILYASLFGLFLVWALQYLPWYFGSRAPGFEMLGLPQYTSMWPLMLNVVIPEFAALLFMLVWFFRRTGRIYLGALMLASIFVWFVAAGSVIGPA